MGLNLDHHTGVLQQSDGNILQLHRDALNVGLGTDAVAAGTVNIPGVFYNVNISQAIFGWLRSARSCAAGNSTASPCATTFC